MNSHGRLQGVHLFNLAAVRQLAPHLFKMLAPGHPGSQPVCVFAFTGRFDQDSVTHPRGRSTGRLAVVVLTTPANQVLGTVIFRHAPLRFGHAHFG